MNYKKFLDKLPNMYIIITDECNKVVYPKNINKLKLISKIYKGFLKEKGYFYYKNNFYEKKKINFNQKNKSYNLYYFKDITKLVNLQKKYEIDDLTKVLNRNTILDKIDNFILKNNGNFSIIMGDIDDFKLINDTYGHIAGDIVLKKIGELLNRELPNCLIGRYGGEEFIILVPNSTNSFNLIEHVRKSISKIVIEYNYTLIKNISMSFGMYNITQKEEINDIKSLRNKYIDNADIALYKSKNNNKNQISIYI